MKTLLGYERPTQKKEIRKVTLFFHPNPLSHLAFTKNWPMGNSLNPCISAHSLHPRFVYMETRRQLTGPHLEASFSNHVPSSGAGPHLISHDKACGASNLYPAQPRSAPSKIFAVTFCFKLGITTLKNIGHQSHLDHLHESSALNTHKTSKSSAHQSTSDTVLKPHFLFWKPSATMDSNARLAGARKLWRAWRTIHQMLSDRVRRYSKDAEIRSVGKSPGLCTWMI